MRFPTKRIVIVSPHLDDAVFSVGATISKARRSGAQVVVLTVFAGEPESALAPGWWDQQAGFQSAGHSTRVRRDEDRAACRIVGATPVWLPFLDSQYRAAGAEQDLSRAISDAVAECDSVLLPGFPLRNADHALVTRIVLEANPNRSLGFYVEQPYAWKLAHASGGSRNVNAISRIAREIASSSQQPPSSVTIGPDTAFVVKWQSSRPSLRDRWAKAQAARAYESQLPLIARHMVVRLMAAELRAGGEKIAWLRREAR